MTCRNGRRAEHPDGCDKSVNRFDAGPFDAYHVYFPQEVRMAGTVVFALCAVVLTFVLAAAASAASQ
ncbi:hypothetical protein A3H16_02895 [Candidatus Kaiserbacteria bacterium RIFCSPLOWO2_12_FULL_53_8]|uniref:Uncharacterized protein n=2 Tax=Candidatus Kaiseribacteriota TaxID=1752734 RepID=A0A1F6CWW4_9BACT|nr:MAG: hypothetical protein A2851_01975 [Candidatus Kaiserbacteria bacterium RIFCSPHIGHO2_01_FULL_53_29]OGG90901.1 MAG: hypothetical protein A3H16_02895 [Candidatus Kaiserbacteria bacterium RIFCSPLOWO2_12_FULL_53_8]